MKVLLLLRVHWGGRRQRGIDIVVWVALGTYWACQRLALGRLGNNLGRVVCIAVSAQSGGDFVRNKSCDQNNT